MTENNDIKSGLILEICKDPVEFFKSIRDDILRLTDESLIDITEKNEEVSFSIIAYFDERFGI